MTNWRRSLTSRAARPASIAWAANRLYDYVIKGYMKEACTAQRRMDGTLSKSVSAHKTKIDSLVMVEPRQIELRLRKPTTDMGGHAHKHTPQGPGDAGVLHGGGGGHDYGIHRQGTWQADFTGATDEWFEKYRQYSGLGQRRSGGWGRFMAEITVIEP